MLILSSFTEKKVIGLQSCASSKNALLKKNIFFV